MGHMKDLLITVYGGGDEAVAAAEKLAELSRWIPVGERLPERNVVVLLHASHDPDKWITMGHRSGDGWYVIEAAEALGHHDLNRFTHWMPLPEPPKVTQ